MASLLKEQLGEPPEEVHAPVGGDCHDCKHREGGGLEWVVARLDQQVREKVAVLEVAWEVHQQCLQIRHHSIHCFYAG